KSGQSPNGDVLFHRCSHHPVLAAESVQRSLGPQEALPRLLSLILKEVQGAGNTMNGDMFFEIEPRQRLQYFCRQLWIGRFVSDKNQFRLLQGLHIETLREYSESPQCS